MIALTMIRYFINKDNIDNLAPFVLKLIKCKTSVVRKKALLVLYSFY